MPKSVLNLYLQKVKDGEDAYLQKLCGRLAERLVHVPITDPSTAAESDGSGMKVNVLRLKETHRFLVPVFTSEHLFKTWSKGRSDAPKSITLLGADFCAVLGKNSWLVINLGSPESCELQPFVVEMIAKAAQDDVPPVRREVAERALGVFEEKPSLSPEHDLEHGHELASSQVVEDSIHIESVSGSKLMVREKSSTAIPSPVEKDKTEHKKRSFLSFLRLAK